MQTTPLASRSRAPASRQARAFAWLALLAACADGPDGEQPDPAADAGITVVEREAGAPTSTPSSGGTTGPVQSARDDSSVPAQTPTSATSGTDSGTQPASSTRDAGTRPTSADTASGTPSQNEIDSLIDALLGATDGGSSASGDGGASGEWKLEPDSAPECPADPPPIPIIGGPCLGIYYFCGWKNPAGETYTCTCDWVHWLCI